ncbi:MAG: hypothetical protein AB1716_16445, partial [Planctomycetota bacterium]
KDLQAANELFARQEYKAALDALQKIDREALSEAERGQLDSLLKELPEAIQRNERAVQDIAEADAAFDDGDWDAAEKLYQLVRDNKYAPAAAREQAVTRLDRIAEKRKLADAAKPVTPPPPQEPPAPAPAEVKPPVVAPPTEPPVQPQEPAPLTPPPPAPEDQVQAPRRLTPTDELRLREDLLWQRAVAVAEAQMAAARVDMQNREFANARQRVATALQTIEANAHYAEPAAKHQAARQTVLALQDQLDAEYQQWLQAQAEAQRLEVEQRVVARRKEIEEARREKVLQLFNSAEQLRRDRQYAEAAEVLREVLRIDPANEQARFELRWAEDLESLSGQQDWQDTLDVQRRNAIKNAEDALIPWDVDVLYPKNWLELSAQRGRLGVSTGRDVGDLELNRQLDTRLPEITFDETPFDQVIAFLQEMTKVNLSVDWTTITDAGVRRDAPVTLPLKNVKFRTVLSEVLSQVGGGETQLVFAVGEGLIRISTKEKLDQDKLVLIYDIRDLLVNIPRATRQAMFNVTQGMGQQGGGVGGGGGAGSGMFQQGQQQGQQGQDQYGDGQQGVLVEQIMDIIRQTVEPDSWRETGGGDASLRELNGQLIVYNTSAAHQQVTDLLSQLREQRALQISVEARFLNVTNNFLEEFGVDLDFVFNAGNAGYDQAQGPQGVLTDPATGAIILIPRQYSRIGVTPGIPAFGVPLNVGAPVNQPYNQPGFVPAPGSIMPFSSEHFTPVTMQQSSLFLSRPNVSTGVPGSYGTSAGITPALSIAGSFLDNLQVDFLIRATQANSRSSIVQAPRLVLFNGQASRITIGRSRAYVASLEPALAEQAVGFTPIINSADSGVDMYVEGTISADRRYVTLTIQLSNRDEPTFERFETQRASGNSPGAFIMLPDQSFAILETTVSIPDGGTVLLGGVKQVGEVEVEAGVPVLSKIPVLKRAFTNRTLVKDTRTLLILVQTRIIIQKEAEDEAFPTFTRSEM